VVELGCGKSKAQVDGPDGPLTVIGVDLHDFDGVDVIFDLDQPPLPWTRWFWALDNSCRLVICHQLLEHIRHLIPFMNELHRICDWDSYVEVVVPYGVGKPALQDPTHVRFFTEDTFRYWEPGFVDDFGDYGIRGYFAICGQDWRENGNLWTLLHPLKSQEESDRWHELKALTGDGVVRWRPPGWLLDRRAILLGDEAKDGRSAIQKDVD